MKKTMVNVIMQGFYGNRTRTVINENQIDRMLQGIMDERLALDYAPDRTMVKIPNSECVIIYNRHQEDDYRKEVHRWEHKDGYIAKALVDIPEEKLKLYSRCFACRINESGELEDIKNEDFDLVARYLAE